MSAIAVTTVGWDVSGADRFRQQALGVARLMNTATTPRDQWSRLRKRTVVREELLPELRLTAATTTHAGHSVATAAQPIVKTTRVLDDIVATIDRGAATSSALCSLRLTLIDAINDT